MNCAAAGRGRQAPSGGMRRNAEDKRTEKRRHGEWKEGGSDRCENERSVSKFYKLKARHDGFIRRKQQTNVNRKPCLPKRRNATISVWGDAVDGRLHLAAGGLCRGKRHASKSATRTAPNSVRGLADAAEQCTSRDGFRCPPPPHSIRQHAKLVQ